MESYTNNFLNGVNTRTVSDNHNIYLQNWQACNDV
jgi:hypothetical protein